MFKIGEFSKISQVSMRMLRHYDEMGVFQPAHVDRESGYRYYSADQIPRLNRILALKDLGLTLTEIARLVDDKIEAAEIRGMLRLKQSQLQQQVREEQARLSRVQSRLRQIEEEGKQPEHEVIIKRIEAQEVIGIRETAPTVDEMTHLLIQTHQAIYRTGLKHLLPGLALFHDPYFEVTKVDWEIGFPVDPHFQGAVELEDGRPMIRHTLPGVETMACLVYPGSYLGLHIGYSALGAWIEANGFMVNGAGREIFLRVDSSSTQDHVTEIQFPITPARVQLREDA